MEVAEFTLLQIYDIAPKFIFDIENVSLLDSFSARFSLENL